MATAIAAAAAAAGRAPLRAAGSEQFLSQQGASASASAPASAAAGRGGGGGAGGGVGGGGTVWGGAGGRPGAGAGVGAGAGIVASGGSGGGGEGERADANGVGAFGAAGLLDLFRASSERDTPSLAKGVDVSTLGFNLVDPEPLHANFGSSWAAAPVPSEPAFNLPPCYRLTQPGLNRSHLARFDVATLMYMFYAITRDYYQLYAAQELFAREWRFHKVHKKWFNAAGPAEVKVAGATFFYFFDTVSWERKPWPGGGADLPAMFLSEAECKVQRTTA